MVVPAAVDVAAAPSSITLALALLALAPQTPQFRTTSDIVVVDAQVIGRDGQPITTLGAEQFQVTIDGRPRRVEPIDADRDGRAHEIRVKTSQRNATVRSRQVVVIAPRGR